VEVSFQKLTPTERGLVNPDMLTWLKSRESGYRIQINALLRGL
jgi:hypothetical protein